MADIHQMLLDFGRAGAMRIADRKVVEAAAGFLASEENDTGFIYSGWAQTALPHRRLADDALWQVSTDRISLIVQPGVRKTADGAMHVGIPYGSRARLIRVGAQIGR